jgi:8-oxo-dGTP pyrophosphatase MutT (NUDIX family)
MTTEATLLTIIKDGRILLQRKASGRFGEGKWNGVGGKIRPGETPEECAGRETLEETGLRVHNLISHGTLRHYFGDVQEPTWTVHHYSTGEYTGEPKGSDEGELRWFPLDRIPYDEMWQDDIHWLPHQIEGKRFTGDFYFNEDASRLLDFRLTAR